VILFKPFTKLGLRLEVFDHRRSGCLSLSGKGERSRSYHRHASDGRRAFSSKH
jgi:hypothetical protein